MKKTDIRNFGKCGMKKEYRKKTKIRKEIYNKIPIFQRP
jgi:hypothetical protein